MLAKVLLASMNPHDIAEVKPRDILEKIDEIISDATRKIETVHEKFLDIVSQETFNPLCMIFENGFYI